MDFISNSPVQQEEMLRVIGAASIDELFSAIPAFLRLPRQEIEDGMAECEGMRFIEEIASRNSFGDYENYLGAGAYQHHVPALVSAICSKSEFLTSYTPYQPEASQGMLQAIFEFQSAVCALTGMDASNASLYDAASACGEAVLMALRIQKPKEKIVVAASVHPHYRSVVRQYAGMSVQMVEAPFLNNRQLDMSALEVLLDDETAAILLQSPNVFGVVENSQKVFEMARQKGVLCILCANPLAYGIFKSAGEVHADIAVGDCQPLGLPLNYGGPYAGYICCKQEYVRQLPGRVVGETTDSEGKKGYVLTLQAREQHIRREKATSNVCTNQALAALGSLIAMLWYGKKGMLGLALTNYQRTAYLRQCLGVEGDHFFNEFVIEFKNPIEEVMDVFMSEGIIPGFPLKQWYPAMKNALLVCVTELKTREQLDRYASIARGKIISNGPFNDVAGLIQRKDAKAQRHKDG